MKRTLLLVYSIAASSIFAQSWNTTGNSGTNSSINLPEITDNQTLIFKSNNNPVLRLLPSGSIRIDL